MNRLARVRPGFLALAILAASVTPGLAQFGKNKVSYETFDWKVYESPHFLVHYYPEMEIFLEEVVSYAESAYLNVSRDLDHELRFKVPLIVYRTHGEFQRTNIQLAELPDGVAAFAEPIQNRMVLPIDLPPDQLYELIAHELVHIFEYSMFFEGYLGRTLRSRPPTWLMEGLASFIAQDESNLDRMAIRDAVVNNILPPIEQLTVVTFLTYRYGHAIFAYIQQEHGEEGLRTFLFEYRKVLLANNLEKAFKESFGYGLNEFNRRFNRHLRKKYFPVLLEKKSPDEYGTEIGLARPGAYTFSPVLSPSGELVGAFSTPKLELDLVVLSADDGKLIKNLSKGWTNKWRNLETNAFSGKRDLSWSPVADEIAVFVRREDKWPLEIFDALTGERAGRVVFDDIVECASPVYSPDGRRIAFEGNRDGVVDIFEYDLETGAVRNVTDDPYFDANPWYAPDGSSLLYNRRIGEHWKIFSVDLSDSELKQQLSFGPSSDIQASYSRDGKTLFFSSDRGAEGIFNIWSLNVETGELARHTDVVGGVFAPVEMAERDGERHLVFTAFFEGQFRLYRMPILGAEETISADDAPAPAEAEPFAPTLTLSTDASAKADYRLKWDIESPAVEIGVADDGTFLSNAAIQFSDLLGNHRALINFSSVSDFANYQAAYFNLKRRAVWGARAYSLSDFYLSADAVSVDEVSTRVTGVGGFVQYPFSRHYRVEAAVGVSDTAQDLAVDQAPNGDLIFDRFSDRFASVGLSLVGDTSRYAGFSGVAPFQGKRFSLGVEYSPHLSGDFPGDIVEYHLDYRGYKQATTRSTLAFRFGARYNAGDRAYQYGYGGLNLLRGYRFREFTGSRLTWANAEFRFPLVDRLDFPILRLAQIRGFFFVDAGGAWSLDDSWYDPVLGTTRIDPSTGRAVEFDFWDSENDRLQDLRVSYGGGFQFLFLGGLQFNWAWSKPLPHTQFCSAGVAPECVFIDNGLNPSPLEKRKFERNTKFDFYIAFDW